MKFLTGMICGLVVAIAVPFALAMPGAAARRDGSSARKSPPPTHEPEEKRSPVR